MRSAFFEFNVAVSALNTARGALNVTAHNVANASTTGYSRQVVEQRASWPLSLNTGKGMVGTGSEIYGVAQIRNFYLDKKYWKNVSTLGEYALKSTQLSLTETILDEMAGSGLKTQFNNFFNRIQELSTNAGDSTYRTNLIQLAESITTYFGNTYESLRQQQIDLNEEIKATVTIINSLAQQIATLNKQIYQFELTGSAANDLRDQRARLIDELSIYVNVEVKETERNADYAAGLYPEPEDRFRSERQLTIMLNGHVLVDHFDFNQLEVKERTVDDNGTNVSVYYNPEDAAGLYDIYWAGTGAKFNMYSSELKGELKALIDLRDGNNQNYVSLNTGYNGTYLTFDFSALALTFDPENDVDKIRFYDPSTGALLLELDYSDVVYDPVTGMATFRLADSSGNPISLPGNLAGADVKILTTSAVEEDVTAAPYTVQVDVNYDYDGSVLSLNLTDAQRADLNKDGGLIKIYDPATGVTREYVYSKYEYDPVTGEAKFTLVQPADVPNIANAKVTIGQTCNYKGIPYYMSRLNTLARTFVTAINEGKRLDGSAIQDVIGHLDGFNTDGYSLDTLFFTYIDPDTGQEKLWDSSFNINDVTALSIRVNSELLTDPSLLQASSESTGGISNNEVILSLIKISTDKSLFREGTLGDYIIGITGELGIQQAQAVNFTNSYTDLVINTDNQRMSVSGVNLDEEMVAMIKYQQQYVAASKLINVIDSIYDTLINRLGNF